MRDVVETRAAEAAAGVEESVLIARASWAVAHRVVELAGRAYGLEVLVVAGTGHNAADAVRAGVHLARRGAGVTACLVTERDGDGHLASALRDLRAAGGRLVSLDEAERTDASYAVGVDGLTGIGFAPRDEARERPFARAAAVVQTCDLVVAVDLPSGVVADTGAAAPWAVHADVTVTFGALKSGLVVGPGAELAGLVEVADIGLPSGEPTSVGVLDAWDVAAALPMPGPTATKYSRGGVGLIGGGDAYVGAAVLAAGGALRAGAGSVRVHAPRETIAAVRARWPEVVGIPLHLDEIASGAKVDAWVAGPGLGTDDRAHAVLEAVLASDRPAVLDADAITLLAQDADLVRRRAAPTVLTPHTGEFQRLTGVPAGDAAANPLGAARDAARDLRAIVLLKGMRTVIAAPDGTARINPTGTPWLAAAGSGDVLAGAVGSHLAGGVDPLSAAACAAWLHGLAGRLASQDAPIVATDLIELWPEALRRVRG
ncbi:MAG TPA: NAD(P)H-hydrate dehydratase [Mycobacteriales bacterium]|nr:NAD(P)H-hydrate dehydratase [Mycobacteriales bacterium]